MTSCCVCGKSLPRLIGGSGYTDLLEVGHTYCDLHNPWIGDDPVFLVSCFSTLEEGWEDLDRVIRQTAGHNISYSAASKPPGTAGVREHHWELRSFEEARMLKLKLEGIPGLEVDLRER